MVKAFQNREKEDVFNGKATKGARKICPQQLWKIAFRKLDQLDSVLSLDDLRIPPGSRLEALSGNRKGAYRINDQYRICFTWTENGPADVEKTDYH